MHPATAKWYDRRDSVYIEFCVADSKDVKINFEKAKFAFSVDFNNWKDWEDDSDEELGNFDRFSEVGDGDMAFNTQEAMAKMMNNMGGEDDLPDLDGADDDESADSDD
ncbi:unnamed protein product, partial [Coregonus sp. 'balchen']